MRVEKAGGETDVKVNSKFRLTRNYSAFGHPHLAFSRLHKRCFTIR